MLRASDNLWAAADIEPNCKYARVMAAAFLDGGVPVKRSTSPEYTCGKLYSAPTQLASER